MMAVAEFEPSSVCLDKIFQNFMKDSNEKHSFAVVKCAKNRYNCFNSNNNSDDEFDFFSDSISVNSFFNNLSDTLKGKLSEAKIDSFNIPYYTPTPQQLKAILERSHNFSIERMEILNNTGKSAFPSAGAYAAAFRATHESLCAHHFGVEIIDELFDLYEKKLAASSVFSNADNDKTLVILAVLKRTVD